MLSANEVRAEKGWPRSDDPTADSIAPAVVGMAAAPVDEPTTSPAPPPYDGNKIVHIHHAAD